jgi:hypothetical protein
MESCHGYLTLIVHGETRYLYKNVTLWHYCMQFGILAIP